MDVPVENKLSSNNVSDALQAVRQDPAVLEATITMDNKTKPKEEDPCSDDEQKADREPEKNGASSSLSKFEEMMRIQKAALMTLTPHQFDLILKYVNILRLQRYVKQKSLECAFCKKNGEPSAWYSVHRLRDKTGRLRCPVLRAYHCPHCGATGDEAHTVKYCPLNRNTDRWSY